MPRGLPTGAAQRPKLHAFARFSFPLICTFDIAALSIEDDLHH
jgi:hypothetical protein